MLAELAVAQLRHRPARWLLLAVGVSLALAIPVVSSGTGRIVAAQTVRHAVDQLAPTARSIVVSDVPTVLDTRGLPRLDAEIIASLRGLSAAPVRRQLLYHQLTVAGSTFFLTATDDLPSAIRLTSGRLPRQCTPTRCEVVSIGGADDALARAAVSLGIVVVGQAERTDPLLAAGEFGTGTGRVLVGASVQAMAKLAALELFGRTYGWTAPLDTRRITHLGVPAYLARSAAVSDTLSRIYGVSVTAPDDVLAGQDARARTSARRFGLLGGSAAALLLGFAVVAAAGLRREHTVLVAVLRRRGATRAQVTVLTVLQAGAACLAGAGAGLLLGMIVTARLAAGTGLAETATAAHALGAAALGSAVLVVAAVAVTTAVLLWRDEDARTLWQGLDLLALACFGAVLLAANRGSASTASLAARSDPLVVALPVLTAVTAGLVAARLWGPLARLAERAVPRRSVAGRIALLGAIRRPLRPLATVAFLTAAITSVVFAGAYRATLLNGAADQAAYAVPLDARITAGTELVDPLAVDPVAHVPAGTALYPVVRTSGVYRTRTDSATQVPLVGIDPDAIGAAHRWSRTSGADRSAGRLATLLTGASVAAAPTVPAGTAKVSIVASSTPAALQVSLWLASADGRERSVVLRRAGLVLVGTMPSLGSGALRVVGLSFGEDPDYATHHQHAVGEGTTDQPVVAGSVSFGSVSADHAPLDWSWSRWTSLRADVTAAAAGLIVGYRLLGNPVIAVPGTVLPTSLPVVVDPATAAAAPGGQLALTVDGVAVTGRVVATVPRLPTAPGRFVLANRVTLSALLDGITPGSGAAHELWLRGSTATLRQAPFDLLDVTVRAALQDSLTTDPVGRGSRLLLLLVAGLAMLVAAASLVLLVVGERRDGAAELLAWESDGVRPALLRRMLVLRAASIVAVAVPLGLIAGVLLAAAGARLIAVDASGSVPVPPLQLAVGLAPTLLTLLLALACALGVAAAVAAQMLRERLPALPEVDLR